MSSITPGGPPQPVQAESAAQLIGSIGVNVHSYYLDTAYGRNEADIIPDIGYLGISNVRESIDDASPGVRLGLLEDMIAAGIKLDLGTGTASSQAPITEITANLTALEQAHPGGVYSIEGLNEDPDLAHAQAYQTLIYNAVKSNPLLSGIQVANFTGYSTSASSYDTNVSSTATLGNAHSYSADMPPYFFNSWYVGIQTVNQNSGQPFVVTETGYDTALVLPAGATESVGVNQDVQAKYDLDTIFDMAASGVDKVYFYELLDENPNPSFNEDNFGFFDTNNAPKEAAVGLHNLTTILADTGPNASSFTPGTLSYSVSGLNAPIAPSQLEAWYYDGILLPGLIESLPTYGNSYLLAKSNGSFDLAVWKEPEIWDRYTNSEIAAPSGPVTVTLASEAASVEVFDPLIGTSPIATYTNATQVTVQVSDHPIIIEIDPMAPTPVPIPTPVPTPIPAPVPAPTPTPAPVLAADNPAAGTYGLSHGNYQYGSSDGNTLQVTNLGTGASSQLSEGQVVAFADGTAIADPNGTVGEVLRLYQAAFDRLPSGSEAGGVGFWERALQQGSSLQDVAQGFSTTPEYAAHYAGTTDDQFVSALYDNVLGRAGDPNGRAFWDSALQSGEGRSTALMQFAESPENESRSIASSGAADAANITRLYQAAFDRHPDAGGLSFWQGTYDRGASLDDIAIGMQGSTEYQALYAGTGNDGFVRALYKNVLGDTPAAGNAGVQFWDAQLAGGASRADVLIGFANSLENRLQTSGSTHDGIAFLGS